MPLSNVRSPIAAGNANRARLLRFADQELGRSFRAFAPTIWPGPPWQAFLGFITTANLTDNTTTGDSSQRFHEIGVGQVPAGPREGPAPNPDPNAPDNAWTRLAGTPSVVAALGRPATTVPDAWKTAPRDQAAMTIASLRNDYASVVRSLRPELRPTRDDTPYAVALAFMSFSAGGAGAANHWNRFAAQLAPVPEAQRWTALLQLLANGIRNGSIQPGAGGSHSNPFYSAMRTWQKMESAKQVAQGTGGNADFFDAHLSNPNAVDDAITAGARGQHPSAIPGLSQEELGWGARAAGAFQLAWLGVAAATYGAVRLWQKRRGR